MTCPVVREIRIPAPSPFDELTHFWSSLN